MYASVKGYDLKVQYVEFSGIKWNGHKMKYNIQRYVLICV
jgi:hypothetical protein